MLWSHLGESGSPAPLDQSANQVAYLGFGPGVVGNIEVLNDIAEVAAHLGEAGRIDRKVGLADADMGSPPRVYVAAVHRRDQGERSDDA